ncbi:MAG: ROK family protein [Casimicrobiaceae bacterium]
MLRLGIDLGGTKMEIIALDDDGRELARRRMPTPQGDYRATLTAIAQLVAATENHLGERGTVGIGTPGALSRRTGLLKNANSVCLNGQPIKEHLEEMLAREIRIANDANCFALSEAVDGAGIAAEVVFGVILGTGCGGGVVVNRHVLTGINAIAGEWGHNPLPLPTPEDLPLPPCFCGHFGCNELYLSGTGLARDHLKVTGETASAEAIVARSQWNDLGCEASLERYEERLARALGYVINIVDPDVVVLGGGMSNVDRLYENVPRIWNRYVASDFVDTRLLRNVHGDSSGVRGAAWLWGSGHDRRNSRR